MNMFRAGLLVIACVATPLAFAQWQWVDKDGRKVFSDQPPPPGTPSDKILKRPGNRAAPVEEPEAKPAAAPTPKLTGKDSELEAKRKAASAAEAERKRAADEEFARVKAENCARAKTAKATLDSGTRLSFTNAKGETEIMDDNARAAEAKRINAAIASNCG